MRPIDADVLLTIFKDKYCDMVAGRYPFNIVVYDLAKIIEEQPTLDYAPVRHGEWIDGLKCEFCGQVDLTKPNYCPNCGAKMDGGKAE